MKASTKERPMVAAHNTYNAITPVWMVRERGSTILTELREFFPSTLLCLHQLVLDGVNDQLGALLQMQLSQDVAYMCLDCLFTDK